MLDCCRLSWSLFVVAVAVVVFLETNSSHSGSCVCGQLAAHLAATRHSPPLFGSCPPRVPIVCLHTPPTVCVGKAVVGPLAASAAACAVFLQAAHLNYPGGYAGERMAVHLDSLPPRAAPFVVHVDNLAAQSGFSRFSEREVVGQPGMTTMVSGAPVFVVYSSVLGAGVVDGAPRRVWVND